MTTIEKVPHPPSTWSLQEALENFVFHPRHDTYDEAKAYVDALVKWMNTITDKYTEGLSPAPKEIEDLARSYAEREQKEFYALSHAQRARYRQHARRECSSRSDR